jgi:N-acyl-D-aspartate/D-glutamate deacylase
VYADTEDAADLFSRVEAVPRKFVLGALEAKKTWSTPAEYVQTLDELPLGPNVSSMLGHSDLRTSVLGLDRATTEGVRPTDAELERMARLLDQALDAGLLGMSGWMPRSTSSTATASDHVLCHRHSPHGASAAG